MPLHIDIAVDAPGWPDEAALEPLVRGAVGAAAAHVGQVPDMSELSLLFTNDEAVARLNQRWRGKPGPTNVLSFPASALSPGEVAGPLLGDIVLAYGTVAREAAIDGKPFDAHLSHLIIHGFLHLLGYDHQDDRQAETMERLEREILAKLGVNDPYAPVSDT